jgi:hypothetical protein
MMAFTRSLEQRDTYLGFQPLQPPGNGWLGYLQHIGRLPQIAVLRHRQKCSEIVPIHETNFYRKTRLKVNSRIIDHAHFAWITGAVGWVIRRPGDVAADVEGPIPEATLLRPLAEYEAIVGGAW